MRLLIPSLATGRQGKQAAFFRSLTIDHLQVPSTQADFPVLVNFTDATFKTVANGGHVSATNAFTFSSDSAGASLLKWEVERYNATTGEIVAWVKIASLSSASDTVFYLRYGPSIATDQSDPTNVWTSSFLGVYHLKDGTTLSVADSLNTNNGTNNGATAAAGQIDGCGGFVAASNQYIDCGTGINPTAITISAWINAATYPGTSNPVAGRAGSASNFAILYMNASGKMACYVFANASVSYDGTGSHSLLTSTWGHVAMTYSSAAGLIGYFNAASDNTVAANGNIVTTPCTFDIGRDALTTTRYWNGSLDEIRVSSVARSADWITCEYNNQKTSSTFVALGAET